MGQLQGFPPQPVPAYPVPVYKDRRGWLIAFGVVEILIACCFLLLGAFMIFLVPYTKTSQQPQLPENFFYAVGAFYLLLAAGFITVGIGSIRAREWARIAMIITSSMWLGIGVLGTASTAVVMPTILRQQPTPPPPLPPDFQSKVMIGVLGFQAVIMVVLPLVFLLFHCSKNVKATCQGQTTQISSSSRRLPVAMIISILWFAFSAISGIMTGFWMHSITLFGFFVRGISAQIIFWALAAVYAYCAWAFYKRRQEGWWMAVGSLVFWIASGIVSLITLGPGPMVAEGYRQMRIDPSPFSISLQMFTGFFVMGLLVSGILMALIVYCKRYFYTPTTTAA